jgi:hypothetical protein
MPSKVPCVSALIRELGYGRSDWTKRQKLYGLEDDGDEEKFKRFDALMLVFARYSMQPLDP